MNDSAKRPRTASPPRYVETSAGITIRLPDPEKPRPVSAEPLEETAEALTETPFTPTYF